MNELAIFAGAGCGILGSQILGRRIVCAVEWEPYAASVLAQRQNDGLLPPFPIWDDVRTFDGRPWHGVIDVVSGGFPCQDVSIAGTGLGLDGERSGLYSEAIRIIREVRPQRAELENSPMLTSRGLGRVLGDLAELGYDCRWGVIPASSVGAWHERKRIWVAANLDGVWKLQSQRGEQNQRRRTSDSNCQNANALRSRLPSPWAEQMGQDWREAGRGFASGGWWAAEPDVVRVVHGSPARVDRIRALGNAQVPQCAGLAWSLLT